VPRPLKEIIAWDELTKIPDDKREEDIGKLDTPYSWTNLILDAEGYQIAKAKTEWISYQSDMAMWKVQHKIVPKTEHEEIIPLNETV
jgi:hypothetical protein